MNERTYYFEENDQRGYGPADPMAPTETRIETIKKAIKFSRKDHATHEGLETLAASVTFHSTINLDKMLLATRPRALQDAGTNLVDHLLFGIYGNQNREVSKALYELSVCCLPVHGNSQAMLEAMDKLRKIMRWTLPTPVDKRD